MLVELIRDVKALLNTCRCNSVVSRRHFFLQPAASPALPNNCTHCENYFWENENHEKHELPLHLRFNTDSQVVVILYTVLLVVAAIGNLTVIVSLIRSRPRKSSMTLMMKNLNIADLIVTFFIIPLEIGWKITNQWVAGNLACKLFMFLRAFGLYLSSNVLVCLSIDRYLAVLHPLKKYKARRRGRKMVVAAWATSFVCSVPQGIVFHVSQHPEYSEFHQCVPFYYFSSPMLEIAYNLFRISAVYLVPLIIITGANSCILYEIFKMTKENRDEMQRQESRETSSRSGRMCLRRSDNTNIERALIQTIKMLVIKVTAFVCCWTPYVVMSLWYMFDRASAETVNSHLQAGLFIMAVANSCVNPLVYGSYTLDHQKACCRVLCCTFGSNRHPQETELAVSHILQPSVSRPSELCVNNINPNILESQLIRTVGISTHPRALHHHSYFSRNSKGHGETRAAVSEYNLKRIQLELSESAETPEFHSTPDQHLSELISYSSLRETEV